MSTSKLTYEDCLQLKNAGFPQKGNGGELMGNNERPNRFNLERLWIGDKETYQPILDKIVYEPTLPELIEACGIHFYSLTSNLESKWTVKHENGTEYVGSSPEQAVARLYISLALNKK